MSKLQRRSLAGHPGRHTWTRPRLRYPSSFPPSLIQQSSHQTCQTSMRRARLRASRFRPRVKTMKPVSLARLPSRACFTAPGVLFLPLLPAFPPYPCLRTESVADRSNTASWWAERSQPSIQWYAITHRATCKLGGRLGVGRPRGDSVMWHQVQLLDSHLRTSWPPLQEVMPLRRPAGSSYRTT